MYAPLFSGAVLHCYLQNKEKSQRLRCNLSENLRGFTRQLVAYFAANLKADFKNF